MKKEKSYFDTFDAAYLIYGKDGYLIDERLKKMKEEAAKSADMDFNYSSFTAGEDSLDDMLNAAETIPLFSSRRFVVIREAERLYAQELKRFEAWLQSPSEHCTLIFVSRNVTKKSPVFQLLNKYGRVSETQLVMKAKGRVTQDELAQAYLKRIKEEFAKRGLQAENQAAVYLLDFVGEDMAALLSEITKAGYYFKGKKEVRQKDLEGFLSRNYNADFNGFLNALDSRRPAAALEYLENIVEKKSDIQRIYAVFSDRIRFLFEIKVKLSTGNITPKELAREMRWGESKGAEFRAKKTIENASAYSFHELERALKTLFQSEYLLKTSSVDPKIVLEKTIVSVIGKSNN